MTKKNEPTRQQMPVPPSVVPDRYQDRPPVNVYSWVPGPPGSGPPTQVHMVVGTAESGGVLQVLRIKNAGTLDGLIAALQLHRVDVWGSSPLHHAVAVLALVVNRCGARLVDRPDSGQHFLCSDCGAGHQDVEQVDHAPDCLIASAHEALKLLGSFHG